VERHVYIWTAISELGDCAQVERHVYIWTAISELGDCVQVERHVSDVDMALHLHTVS
jgi:hypothetical protein